MSKKTSDPELTRVTFTLEHKISTTQLEKLYIEKHFDRKAIATHLGLNARQLKQVEQAFFPDQKLPTEASYRRQWNEVHWYNGNFAPWTHINAKNGD